MAARLLRGGMAFDGWETLTVAAGEGEDAAAFRDTSLGMHPTKPCGVPLSSWC